MFTITQIYKSWNIVAWFSIKPCHPIPKLHKFHNHDTTIVVENGEHHLSVDFKISYTIVTENNTAT